MSLFDDVSFGFGSKLPLLLQTEATECGLAFLGMVAGFHGYRTDLASLRGRFPVSLKGATLAQLMHIARQMDLGTRALKLWLDLVRQLDIETIAPQHGALFVGKPMVERFLAWCDTLEVGVDLLQPYKMPS